MEQKTKIWPRVLSILSVFVLAGFLIFWNYRQYNEAKKSLAASLNLQLESAGNELTANRWGLLTQKLSKDGRKLTFNNFDDTTRFPKNSSIEIFVDSTSSGYDDFPARDSLTTPQLSTKKQRFQGLQDSVGFTFSLQEEHRTIRNTGEVDSITDIFFTSGIVDNTDGNQDSIFLDLQTWLAPNKNESEELFATYSSKLAENKLPLDFEVFDTESPTGAQILVEFTTTDLVPRTYSAGFNSTGTFLFKKIIPSVLFSVFLLALVATAFWILLSSWTKQRKLVIAKNEFISNVTHELKTPISTVSVALEAIQGFDVLKDKAKTDEYLSISRSELDRLSLLVDKVLKTAQFDSGKTMMLAEQIDFQKIVLSVLKTLKMQMDEKGVAITSDIDEGPLYITGDKIHLTNVVYNLLENAMKYSLESPEIEVRLKNLGNKISLIVSDNGIGISKENQKQIFEKFYRVPSNDRHNVKGHGLGLHYVQKVVADHKGSISVDSSLGKGSSFNISFEKSE